VRAARRLTQKLTLVAKRLGITYRPREATWGG
jgi:hypothetical protein